MCPVRRAPTASVCGTFSRLIQGGQGAKSLDATSRWCRPPWMAGEQGWSGAAMRANLDVKHETQRASAGAHRVACFESPALSVWAVCCTHPPWAFTLAGPGRLFSGARENCVHIHTRSLSWCVERGTQRKRDREKRERERQTGKAAARERPRVFGGGAQPRIQSSAAPHLTQLSPALQNLTWPTLVISGGNQESGMAYLGLHTAAHEGTVL